MSFVASALGAFALARALRCDFPDAFLAGVLFGFSPYITSHGAAGHLELVALEFVALFALLWYQALIRSSWWSLGAGVALAIVGYGSWYYLVAAALLSLTLVIGIALQRRRTSFPHLRTSVRPYVCLLLVYLCAGLCLSPLVLPMLKERSQSRYMDAPLSVAETYSVDVAFTAFSNNLHPLWGQWLARQMHYGPEQVAGISLMALVLCAVCVWKRWRHTLPWTLSAFVFLVLAFGPSLRVAHREPSIRSSLVLFGGGPPGNGWGSPFRAGLSMKLAGSVASQPDMLWNGRTSMTMPFVWLRNLCPPIRPLRAPSRFIIITALCVAVLAAQGLGWVRRSARQRWGRRGEWSVVAVAVGVVVLEYLSLPYPLLSTKVSGFYHELAKEPEPCAIVEVPVEDGREYNFYQTVHGKALFFGFHSRVPAQAIAFRDRNLLLCNLSSAGGYDLQRSLVLESLKDKPLEELRQQFAPSLRELAAVGGKYIILHKAMLKASALKQADRLLREALLLPLRWDDSELRVYQIQEVTTDKP